MKRYGLIGHPLGHSFSRRYFTEKFEREQLDCRYDNFDLETIGEIRRLVKDNPDIKGFNVTIPYKEAILPYLDELDEVAREIRAVNTVLVMADGKLKGFNTDVVGIEASILPWHKSALILGTGGASKAVQYVLKKNGIHFHLASRFPEKADFTYEKLTREIIQSHLLIINATPVGMAPS